MTHDYSHLKRHTFTPESKEEPQLSNQEHALGIRDAIADLNDKIQAAALNDIIISVEVINHIWGPKLQVILSERL